MMKFLLYLICYIFYPFSFLVPRSKKKIAFGSFRGAFNDNAKYLFIYASTYLKDYDICWISPNRNTVGLIRSLGLKAHFVASPAGIWHALTSKFWYINCYTSDIMFCLSGNAVVTDLWHGVGLKKCEFNIDSGALAKRYVEKNFWECYYHPECFRRPNYLISTTPFQSQMFAKAFRIPMQKCLDLGYPRNTILLDNEAEREQFIQRYEAEPVKQLIEKIKQYDTVYIYMPTWRDSQREVFVQNFNLQQLNDALAKQNAIMLMKPHANTLVDSKIFEQYHNLHFITANIDTYAILPYTHVLVTDYSSILYDYILMPQKDVILYIYDYDDYINDRDFYYPFNENTVGKVANNFSALLEIIEHKTYGINPQEREDILTKFWGNSMQGDVCKAILQHTAQVKSL